MENIKDYRNKELTWYIIANILILFCMLSGFNLNITSEVSSTAEIVNKVLGISVFSGIIYVFVFILDSIFDSTTKKYIVNLKFKLPGQVVFNNLKNKKYKDIRFTLEDVENKYKDIYDNMPNEKKEKCNYENKNWYNIYKKHKDDKMIFISNRDYLLSRDMNISTVALLIIYILLTVFNVIPFESIYIIYLIFMIFITNLITRQKSKRFVLNVIAHDLSCK